MKRWIIVGVVGLSLVSSCRAQTVATEEAKQAKVRELFGVMHLDRMMDQMMNAMKGLVDQMISTAPGADEATPEQKKIIASFSDKSMKLAMDSMSWPALEPEYSKIYASTFTMEELDAALTFYKSPAGQSFLNKTPQLMQQSTQIAQRRMADLQPKLKQLQDEMIKELEATSSPAGKPTSPPSH